MTELSLADVSKPLLVLIAGPLPIYDRGYLPTVGEWMALPIIHAAGELPLCRGPTP